MWKPNSTTWQIFKREIVLRNNTPSLFPKARADFSDEMTLDEYVELTSKDMEKSATDANVSETKSFTINGYPAKQFEVSGTVEKVKARWIYTFIDAPKNYHRILAWTLTSKFEENKPVLLDVINSFKELDGKTAAPPPPKKGK